MSKRNRERRALNQVKKTEVKPAVSSPPPDRTDLKRLLEAHDGNVTIIGKDGVILRSFARK